MTQVWERLFVGSLQDAQRLIKGNPDGIDTVISLSEISVGTKRRGINYLHMPIEDAEPVPVRQFDRILDALYENLRWGTVLIHCGVGISRSPSLAGAYMDAVGYQNIDAAIEEIRQRRPSIDPFRILLNSVKENLQ